LADEFPTKRGAFRIPEGGVAALGGAAGFAALFSAAACCVLPLAFAALGLGAGGLAMFVPFHWPLTIAAAAAVIVGWLLHARRRRTCVKDAECRAAGPSRVTFLLLCLATAFVALSALWPTYLERPLMRLLGGA